MVESSTPAAFANLPTVNEAIWNPPPKRTLNPAPEFRVKQEIVDRFTGRSSRLRRASQSPRVYNHTADEVPHILDGLRAEDHILWVLHPLEDMQLPPAGIVEPIISATKQAEFLCVWRNIVPNDSDPLIQWTATAEYPKRTTGLGSETEIQIKALPKFITI